MSRNKSSISFNPIISVYQRVFVCSWKKSVFRTMFSSFPIEGKNILDSHDIKFTELSYLPAAFLRLRVQTGPARHKGGLCDGPTSLVLLGTIPSLSPQKCDVGASPHRVSRDEAKPPFLTAEPRPPRDPEVSLTRRTKGLSGSWVMFHDPEPCSRTMILDRVQGPCSRTMFQNHDLRP